MARAVRLTLATAALLGGVAVAPFDTPAALNAVPRARCSVGKDQRGISRPQENHCEIGAYEHKP